LPSSADQVAGVDVVHDDPGSRSQRRSMLIVAHGLGKTAARSWSPSRHPTDA
jgi:hypothetical protein